MGYTKQKKLTKTTLYLPEYLHTDIKILAVKNHTSMTKLIIQSIKNELYRTSSKQKIKK